MQSIVVQFQIPKCKVRRSEDKNSCPRIDHRSFRHSLGPWEIGLSPYKKTLPYSTCEDQSSCYQWKKQILKALLLGIRNGLEKLRSQKIYAWRLFCSISQNHVLITFYVMNSRSCLFHIISGILHETQLKLNIFSPTFMKNGGICHSDEITFTLDLLFCS